MLAVRKLEVKGSVTQQKERSQRKNVEQGVLGKKMNSARKIRKK